MPSLKPFSLLPLLLPLALAACDSGQPSYSASNATTPPAAPATQPAPPPPVQPPPPPPVTEQTAAPAPSARPVAVSDRRMQSPAQQPSNKAIRLPPAEHVGIGGCDDYVSRYRACLENDRSGMVASPQRKYQLAQALARQVRGWKIQQSKGVPNGDIARACSAASTQAHETLGKLGCGGF